MDYTVRLSRLDDLEDLQKLNEEFNGLDPSSIKTYKNAGYIVKNEVVLQKKI